MSMWGDWKRVGDQLPPRGRVVLVRFEDCSWADACVLDESPDPDVVDEDVWRLAAERPSFRPVSHSTYWREMVEFP